MVLKNGVFFTLTTILFIAVLILLFSADKRASTIDTGTITVESIEQFRGQLENKTFPLLFRQLSYQTLYDLSVDAQQRTLWLRLPPPPGVPNDFSDALLTGSYQGNLLPKYKSLPQALAELTTAANSIGYNLTFGTTSVSLSQSGAFQAAFSVLIDYNLSTPDGTVFYDRSDTMVQEVFTLEGVPDLYYNRMQQAILWNDNRTFRQNRTSPWNNAAIKPFAQSRSYYPSSEAPSIFNRLQGQFGPNPFGVETLINMTQLPADSFTSVDWQYFGLPPALPLAYPCTYELPVALGYPTLRFNLAYLSYYKITGANRIYDNGGNCPQNP